MKNGTPEIGLKKILDMTRGISIFILLLHCYYFCYGAFKTWELTAALSDRLLGNIIRTGLFSSIHKSKYLALAFLVVSLMGAKGKKSEKLNYPIALAYLITELLIYFGAGLILFWREAPQLVGSTYMAITSIGFILILTGGTLLSRIIKLKLQGDVFNKNNQTFPQEERLLENKYSFNFKARYELKGKQRRSQVSIVNPFRSLLTAGLPGSGKTRRIVKPILEQAVRKGFGICLHDFKYPDLTPTNIITV
ncbi:YWFCY domain-containing protein [Filimonas effusa]|uniref:YWFCY domain-containing protein n=1 Tax=Filimonas effusa TaxID=2508721 RepID=UPI001C703EFA|nr:YWFCY domain-containing protein [Filimonas effusa]